MYIAYTELPVIVPAHSAYMQVHTVNKLQTITKQTTGIGHVT